MINLLLTKYEDDIISHFSVIDKNEINDVFDICFSSGEIGNMKSAFYKCDNNDDEIGLSESHYSPEIEDHKKYFISNKFYIEYKDKKTNHILRYKEFDKAVNRLSIFSKNLLKFINMVKKLYPGCEILDSSDFGQNYIKTFIKISENKKINGSDINKYGYSIIPGVEQRILNAKKEIVNILTKKNISKDCIDTLEEYFDLGSKDRISYICLDEDGEEYIVAKGSIDNDKLDINMNVIDSIENYDEYDEDEDDYYHDRY